MLSAHSRICAAPARLQPLASAPLGLYKIFFHWFVCVQESILPLSPPPICITHATAILLRDSCAIYDLPPTLPVYAIHHTILVVTVSCKGQCLTCPAMILWGVRARRSYRRGRCAPYIDIAVSLAIWVSVYRVNPRRALSLASPSAQRRGNAPIDGRRGATRSLHKHVTKCLRDFLLLLSLVSRSLTPSSCQDSSKKASSS